MTIPSFKYIIYLMSACTLYHLLPRRARKCALLLASYGFYCCFTPVGAALLAACTAVAYLGAIAIEADYKGRARQWKALSLTLLFSALFVFKYLDFTLDTLLWCAGAPGVALSLLLPIGISFYTFTATAYIFDVAKGDIKAERNVIDFFLYMSFFPSILSGPINRGQTLLPQIKDPAPFDPERFKRGVLRFALGAAKKLALADILGIYVDSVYGGIAAQGGGALLCAAALYSLQIYFDFSGYTDMALGAGEMLGFTLPENFRAPYLSDSVQLFWQRWHISLTSWFRDYLYFPLGGSRISPKRTRLNILIVFAVSGLWHGAAWHFVFWGALNGLYQLIGRYTLPKRQALWARLGVKGTPLWLRALRAVVVFALISVAWVFFRADSFAAAFALLRGVALIPAAGFGASGLLQLLGVRRLLVAAFSAAVFALDDAYLLAKGRSVFSGLERKRYLFWLAAAAVAAYVLIFGVYGPGFDAQSFVYFRF